MLVFTRKTNQSIVIGDGIEVKILRVGQDGVRLGIEAPHDIAVHRGEVYAAIRTANHSAATADGDALERIAAQLRERLTASRER